MKLREFEGVAGKRDQYQIDPRLLKIRPNFNIRDLTTPAAREKLDILKAQIKAEGVLEALEIEFDGETPWINEGHRRHIVVMELIEEGHDFKSVPCIQERGNVKEDKRTLHMLMRKKEDYEPLEYAKGIDRLVNVYGWDRGDLATALGFKSKGSIDQYLAMVALPEPAKERVREGKESATLAVQLQKEDPDFVEKLRRENEEENKKLGVGQRPKKLTPKKVTKAKEAAKPAPKSDPPKPEPEKTEAPAQPPIMAPNAEVEPARTFSPLSDQTPPHPEPMFRDADEAAHEVHEQLQTAVAREFPAAALQAPTSNRDFDREMFAIVARLATIAEENCIAERTDDELISVPAEVLKAADRAYRSRISDETAEAA